MEFPLILLFVLGIISPKINPTGLIVGTVLSQIPTVIHIIGFIYFPKPVVLENFTSRNATFCSNSTKVIPEVEAVEPYPFWHNIFWISHVGWNAVFVGLIFSLSGKSPEVCSKI